MKYLFVFGFVCIGLVGSLKSQEYIPMAVEGSHWIISYDDINTPPTVDQLWEYYSSGDTCMGTECYKKVFRRELVTSNDPPPFEPDGQYELFGFIRDDSIARKVFAILIDDYFECSSNTEFLLFDFSVDIGDTATSCLIPTFMDFVINSITQKNYIGFETRAFTHSEEDLEYYEGLGSYYGLFEEMFAPVKSVNTRYIYHTFLYFYCRESPCDLIVALSEYFNQEIPVQVSPNPLTISTTLGYTLERPENVQFTFYNLQGQIVYRMQERQDKGVQKVEWSAEGLPAGMYYYRMVAGKQVGSGKLVVGD